MTNFEIEIDDNIDSIAWIEADPFNNEKLCDIYLCVDWEKQEAYVETQCGNNTDYRTYMHLRYDEYAGNDYEITLQLEGAPEHDKYIYFDVAEAFQSYKDLIDMLKYADIDFMTVDLEDVENVKAIREYLSDDVIYIMSDDQFKNDLISMRETIQEEEGEAE